LGCVLMAMSRVDPERIAPKILTGRFERKIFVDNPNGAARKAMILRQLADEDSAHMLTPEDVGFLVEKTAGRSAVNMERLNSSAAICAACAPVSRDDFLTALEEEPSDFDRLTAARNAKYDQKHGWHPV
jgi:SpoVK/Ycf46/Vps4 family AAA+-type ATPase